MKHLSTRKFALSVVMAVAVVFAFMGVASAAPGAFNIVGPADGTMLTDPTGDLQPTWEVSAEADTYLFVLTFPDATDTGATFDGLICDASDTNADGLELVAGTPDTCVLTIGTIEDVLTQEGTYSWQVTATDADDGDSTLTAANGPFTFDVDLTDPAFNLLAPGSDTSPGPELEQPTGAVDITWEESEGATDYTFAITNPSDATTTLADLTPADDGEENAGSSLVCATGTCTLTVNAIEGVLTEEGEYDWTVSAFDAEDNETVASNAPFFFDVDLTADPAGPFNLVGPGSDMEPFPELEQPTGAAEIRWEVSAGASLYAFELTFPETTDPVEFNDLTCDAADTDMDGVALDDTVDPNQCVFTVDPIEGTLTAAGTYEWTVFAYVDPRNVVLRDVSDETEAANAPFSFIVDLEPDAGPFNLLTPADGTEVTDVTAVTAITWEESANADSYTFNLDRPTLDDVTILDQTPADDADALVCAAGTCTLTVVGETVLLENGLYSWTVQANNSAGADFTIATNAPFTFTVNDPSLEVPGDFMLMAPANNTLFRATLPAATQITWGESAGAATYGFVLIQISENNTRLGVEANLSDLTCDATDTDMDGLGSDGAGNCVLTIDASTLTDGQYAWTATSTNDNGTTEAMNAPWFFEIDTDPVTVVSSGFEESEDVNADKVPDQFEQRGQFAGDKIRCDTDTKTFANSGDCAFQFKKNENGRSRLRFEFDPTEYSLGVGDTITVSIAVDVKNFEDDRTFGKVRVRFDETLDDGTRAKVVERLRTVNTVDGYEVVTLDIVLDRADFFGNIRVDISDVTGPGNRILVDDFSVVLTAPSGAPTTILPAAPAAPALPDAPEGFRG